MFLFSFVRIVRVILLSRLGGLEKRVSPLAESSDRVVSRFHIFMQFGESWEPFVRRHFFVCFSRRDWKVPACAVWSFSVCSQYRLPGILRRLDLFVWVWFWFGLSVCRRVACAGNSDC